jgi:hypothetical protein
MTIVCYLATLLEKRVLKRLFASSPRRTLFGSRENPFGFHVEPSVERVLPGDKKGYSKANNTGTVEEPLKVLDSTFPHPYCTIRSDWWHDVRWAYMLIGL